MQAMFECTDCGESIRDEVMPEVPACICGRYMRMVEGSQVGELSMGMQRMHDEYEMETS